MAADILDRLLTTLAVRIHAFALCQIECGWRIAVDPMQIVTLHYVLAGSGVIATDDCLPTAFGPNSIIIVPAGVSQTIGDPSPAAAVRNASDILQIRADGLLDFSAGEGTKDILCACGSIAATYALGLFDFLKEPLVEDLSCSSTVRQIFHLLLSEVRAPSLGTQAMAESLMKQCLVILMRQHFARLETSPFLGGLKDTRLARAIASVVERPAAAHTVDGLAEIAGMSRSTFAERFAAAYGQSPIEFVQKVRMRVGAQLLLATDMPVKVVAGSVGYASRSYFTRAFRSAFGTDPTTYRAHDGAVPL